MIKIDGEFRLVVPTSGGRGGGDHEGGGGAGTEVGGGGKLNSESCLGQSCSGRVRGRGWGLVSCGRTGLLSRWHFLSPYELLFLLLPAYIHVCKQESCARTWQDRSMSFVVYQQV